MTAALDVWLPAWAEELGEDRFGIFAGFSVEEVGFRFRWIPPGGFRMGSPEDELGRDDREGPRHAVAMTRGFWLGETPVTQGQWRAVMGELSKEIDEVEQDAPVVYENWDDSVGFAERLAELRPGFPARLPTEAEWEYACRAGTESAFNNGAACTSAFGKDTGLDEVGWYDGNSEGRLQVVKQLQANEWGLYDMHGNVWEWCWDGRRTYETYEAEGATDPVGSQDGARGLVRGGSWFARARYCRSACRDGFDRGARFDDLGLRLAAGPEPGIRSSPAQDQVQGSAEPTSGLGRLGQE